MKDPAVLAAAMYAHKLAKQRRRAVVYHTAARGSTELKRMMETSAILLCSCCRNAEAENGLLRKVEALDTAGMQRWLCMKLHASYALLILTFAGDFHLLASHRASRQTLRR